MQAKDIKKWRRDLGFSQEEAGRVLGVSRITIQNWENGSTPVPAMAEGACERATRHWKQRPDYGPVTLAYYDAPLGQFRGVPHVEQFATTQAALQFVQQLWGTPSFHSPTILDNETSLPIWLFHELEREIRRRMQQTHAAPDKEKLLDALLEIGRHYRSLPLLDDRTAEEIIGYDDDGLPS